MRATARWSLTVGGYAVAANATHLFISGRIGNEGGGLKDPETWPPAGRDWIGVSRRPLTDIRQAAPFPGGKGGKGDTLKGVFLVVDEVPVDKISLDARRANITGLAASAQRLWASCPYDDSIKVFEWDFASVRSFPHPAGFQQIKRLRYDPSTECPYLGGTTAEHTNQHWKPMGPVIARYDGWLKSEGRAEPRWRIVAPYEHGSRGPSSCEPMSFDVAGEYLFVPYTGASKSLPFKTGHVEVFRADDGRSVGHFEPSADIGEIGLQDIRECLRAHRRADGEYLSFLEDDYKAKVLLYRWRP